MSTVSQEKASVRHPEYQREYLQRTNDGTIQNKVINWLMIQTTYEDNPYLEPISEEFNFSLGRDNISGSYRNIKMKDQTTNLNKFLIKSNYPDIKEVQENFSLDTNMLQSIINDYNTKQDKFYEEVFGNESKDIK